MTIAGSAQRRYSPSAATMSDVLPETPAANSKKVEPGERHVLSYAAPVDYMPEIPPPGQLDFAIAFTIPFVTTMFFWLFLGAILSVAMGTYFKFSLPMVVAAYFIVVERTKSPGISGFTMTEDVSDHAVAKHHEFDAGKPVALSYESPLDRAKRNPPKNIVGMTFAFLTGFTMAAIAWVALTVIICVSWILGNGRFSKLIGLFYVIGSALVSLVSARVTREVKTGDLDRWWTYGALAGTGLVLLLGGVIFLAIKPY